MAALSVHKGNLSTMLSIVPSFARPTHRSHRTSPRIGRPRWDELEAKVEIAPDAWRRIVKEEDFSSLSSDARFASVLKHLSPKKGAAEMLISSSGQEIGTFSLAQGRMKLTVSQRAAPGFAEFLIQETSQPSRRVSASKIVAYCVWLNRRRFAKEKRSPKHCCSEASSLHVWRLKKTTFRESLSRSQRRFARADFFCLMTGTDHARISSDDAFRAAASDYCPNCDADRDAAGG